MQYNFSLNCFRSGPFRKSLNVEISMGPVYADKTIVEGRMISLQNQTSGTCMHPYTAFKRIRCYNLDLTEEPIMNYRDAVAFRPQSNYWKNTSEPAESGPPLSLAVEQKIQLFCLSGPVTLIHETFIHTIIIVAKGLQGFVTWCNASADRRSQCYDLFEHEVYSSLGNGCSWL